MVMKNLVTEKGSAKAGEGKAEGSSRNAEHQSPPMLHLGHEHMKALGLHKGPVPFKVGDKIHVHALVHVGAISESQHDNPSGGKAPGGEGNTHRTMTLHFHKMDMGDGTQPGVKEVDQEAEKAKGAKAEMDKALKREAGGKGKDSEGEEGAQDTVPRGGED